MDDFDKAELQALVFKNRGALLSLPAAALALLGRPSPRSVAAGLPIALAGEAIRCWAVGYSGATTRADTVTAPHLVTAGPYAYVRNPLYAGNLVTALGFAVAFTGDNAPGERFALIAGSIAAMTAVYRVIVPHEERFLRTEFGQAFDAYCAAVPAVLPRRSPAPGGRGSWNPDVIASAESRTFVTFGVMLGVLALKALRR